MTIFNDSHPDALLPSGKFSRHIRHPFRVDQAETQLALATTPEETMGIEAVSSAAVAYHKELGDFETAVDAARIYILARRRTTELIEPDILHGSVDGYGHREVTLADYSFTKMQWARRKKELEVTEEDVEAYIADCVERGVIPTPWGLRMPLTEHTEQGPPCPMCGTRKRIPKTTIEGEVK